MKIALYSLISLLCVQVAFGASFLRDRTDINTDHLTQSKQSAVSAYTNSNGISPRLNLFACFPAVRDIASIIWSGFSLLRERSQIMQKVATGKENCNKVGGTPEYLEKCLQLVEDERKADQEELNTKILALVPRIFTALLSLSKCLL